MDAFIADLKDAVQEAKLAPSGKGTMVALYGTSLLLFDLNFLCRDMNECRCANLSVCVPCAGLGESSAVGPEMVSEIATAFLDTLYKA